MPLQASPAGLLGRFAPSGFALNTQSLCSLGLHALQLHSQSLCSLGLRAARSHLASFLTQSTRNALKGIESQKEKKNYPFDAIRSSCVAQSESGEAQPNLPHPRVPRSVNAKFHADCFKTVGARGIHTDTHKDRQSFFYY